MFKVNNKDTRTTPWCRSGIFIVNFEQVITGWECTLKIFKIQFNPFHVSGLFLYPLKSLEKLRFTDFFEKIFLITNFSKKTKKEKTDSGTGIQLNSRKIWCIT